MPDRDYFDRDRDREYREREYRDRSQERNREGYRGEGWTERPVGSHYYGGGSDWENSRREEQPNRGGEWGRESRQEHWNRPQYNERRDPYTRGEEAERWGRGTEGRDPWWDSNREENRWRDRSGAWDRGSSEHYQRGGSGSEAGYGSERSYGTPRGFTRRGGGTGLRDDESWSVRNRERDIRGDYSYGGGIGGGFGNSRSYGGGWGGGMSGYSASMGTYMDRAQSYGGFSGRGPRGWRRSDERIREDVNERLTMHPDIDATDIDVQVRECEVVLSGTVDDRRVKRMAEELAENISGVKEVHNQIRVQRVDDRSRERERDQGLGSGFSTTTGNRPEAPLGLSQPQQGHQRSAQQTVQYGQQQQHPNQPQPQYAGSGQNQGTGPNRGNR
jgi:hypothetical protein